MCVHNIEECVCVYCLIYRHVQSTTLYSVYPSVIFSNDFNERGRDIERESHHLPERAIVWMT